MVKELKMKVLTALAIAAATAAALSTTAMATVAEVAANGNLGNDATAAPANNIIPGANPSSSGNANKSNNNPYEGNPGGKPSASQHRALKSERMAERRARVKAAIADLPNEPDSKLHRMDSAELESAVEAAEESARRRGLKFESMQNGGRNNDNPGGGFIRKAKTEMEKNLEEEEGRRRMWGNEGNGDPYEPMGGLVEETNYYGESLFDTHATDIAFVHVMGASFLWLLNIF